MPTTTITITEFRRYYEDVEEQFLNELQSSGLIRLQDTAQGPAIDCDELPHVEQYARLHYDLDINLPGIEAIHHLLERMERLHEELRLLRSRAPGSAGFVEE